MVTPMTTSEYTESVENYLEVILDLESTHKVARAKDIADRLAINRGSVTGALKNLGEKGLINYAPYSYVTLTPKGRRVAAEIHRRHRVLEDFLLNVLGIDADTAKDTACRMEHAIDKITVDRLICFIEYIRNCPRAGEDWVKAFVTYCESAPDEKPDCELCLKIMQEGK
jgi:DtxR family Mn-dependent transcriptional regulator